MPKFLFRYFHHHDVVPASVIEQGSRRRATWNVANFHPITIVHQANIFGLKCGRGWLTHLNDGDMPLCEIEVRDQSSATLGALLPSEQACKNAISNVAEATFCRSTNEFIEALV